MFRLSCALAGSVIALVIASVLVACGGSSGTDDGESTASSAAGYPVTVESAYGNLKLAQRPERIVVLSPAYVDMLTSIDVQPVAISGGTIAAGADFDREFPWLAGAYEGKVDPELIPAQTNETSLERVARYKPDLILAHKWSIPQERYADFSKIAPTYVSSDDGSAATSWARDMTAIGNLTGRSGAAGDLLDAFNTKLKRFRDRVVATRGHTYNSFAVRPNGFQYGSGGPLALLGLKPAKDQGTYTDPLLSFENVDRFAADVLLVGVWSDADRRKFESDPRVPNLPAAKNKAVIFSDSVMANAATLPSPSSVTYVLDRIVPVLERSRLNTGSG